MSLVSRLRSACLTWPKTGEWLICLGIYSVTTVAIAAVAFTFGLIRWQPHFSDWPMRLTVFAVPAFTEELFFRGLMIPGRDGGPQGDGRSAVRLIAFGTLAFVLWHVVEAATILPGARLFLHPAFLSCAGLLGLACAITRYRTGSLWPAVLFHGLVVFAWQVLFGGPTVQDLLH